jgi:hypothetical protein
MREDNTVQFQTMCNLIGDDVSLGGFRNSFAPFTNFNAIILFVAIQRDAVRFDRACPVTCKSTGLSASPIGHFPYLASDSTRFSK